MSFLIYAIVSVPYYIVKRWVVNYTYDKEYAEVYTEGKKTFDSPRQTLNLTMPKECVTLKPRFYEKQKKSN